MSFLKVKGDKIVDEDGNKVNLRGAAIGGWLKYAPPNALFHFSIHNQ